MTIPETRLFHLHYHVPDVEYAERVLVGRGLPLHAKFGSIGDEMVALQPGEEPPEGFRFRLQDAQRGYANITLTAGNQVRFDHFGVVTSEYESIVQRANDADWDVHGVDEPRTFLFTPWGFRIELHPEDGRVVDSLGSWRECRFGEAVLTVPDAAAVRRDLDSVVGRISNLSVREGQTVRPHVPQATLVGDAAFDDRTIHAASLADEQGSDR